MAANAIGRGDGDATIPANRDSHSQRSMRTGSLGPWMEAQAEPTKRCGDMDAGLFSPKAREATGQRGEGPTRKARADG